MRKLSDAFWRWVARRIRAAEDRDVFEGTETDLYRVPGPEQWVTVSPSRRFISGFSDIRPWEPDSK